jgi:hypothetical protein
VDDVIAEFGSTYPMSPMEAGRVDDPIMALKPGEHTYEIFD